MHYVVEYTDGAGQAYAKAFKKHATANEFAKSLGARLLDFFSEMIVEETEEFTVYKRLENLLNG